MRKLIRQGGWRHFRITGPQQFHKEILHRTPGSQRTPSNQLLGPGDFPSENVHEDPFNKIPQQPQITLCPGAILLGGVLMDVFTAEIPWVT